VAVAHRRGAVEEVAFVELRKEVDCDDLVEQVGIEVRSVAFEVNEGFGVVDAIDWRERAEALVSAVQRESKSMPSGARSWS